MASGSISKPKRWAELSDAATRLARVEEHAPAHRLLAEDDVLGHGEDRDEHEVLVDHVDAAGDGIGRTADRDLLAVKDDRALVGLGEPVENVHQRGLARTVLAEERVDLPGPDGQVDVVVRDDARDSAS